MRDSSHMTVTLRYEISVRMLTQHRPSFRAGPREGLGTRLWLHQTVFQSGHPPRARPRTSADARLLRAPTTCTPRGPLGPLSLSHSPVLNSLPQLLKESKGFCSDIFQEVTAQIYTYYEDEQNLVNWPIHCWQGAIGSYNLC